MRTAKSFFSPAAVKSLEKYEYTPNPIMHTPMIIPKVRRIPSKVDNLRTERVFRTSGEAASFLAPSNRSTILSSLGGDGD